MAKLIEQRYGKAKVRVLKILRDGPIHTIREIEVSALLAGDFETSYTAGDNSKVVATDTIKNTVNVLAKQHLAEDLERFAALVGEHFVRRYEQVSEATIEVAERAWNRLEVSGKPHPHTFEAGSEARRFGRAICRAGSSELSAGIRDLVILKSTGSGFEGYPKCEYTTLPETADRILATSFSATWHFAGVPASYRTTDEAILAAMIKVFAENFSPSAQTTLFQMGEAAFQACAEISRIDLAMPNKHCLLINLAPFGLENKNEVFVPTEEPFGLIEASLSRDQ
ncbi:MAG: urate oxidase [Verrucomicrobiota bacterium]|nr:urate oxidase [Chthoniobacterales bacterium]MDQ3414640.1 urate oxidase [Verrucomicrobiota bacterium]